MEEINMYNYSGLYIPFTQEEFFEKDELISNNLFGDESKYLGGDLNYSNPIININNVYFMVVNTEVLSYFSQYELDNAIAYNTIQLNN
jgi:hypothetical protein